MGHLPASRRGHADFSDALATYRPPNHPQVAGSHSETPGGYNVRLGTNHAIFLRVMRAAQRRGSLLENLEIRASRRCDGLSLFLFGLE